jgi:N-succinyl-L-ornithine transcarbamylase
MHSFFSADGAEPVSDLLAEALALKSGKKKTLPKKGKRMGLIFLNPSLRTRLSTQLAARDLGIEVFCFEPGKDGWSLEYEDEVIMNGNTSEHIREAAGVLGKYFDCLGIRAFPGLKNKAEDQSEKIFRAFENYAGVPIVNLESATLHPLQSFADLITISETWKAKSGKGKPKVVLTWAPHCKALPHCVAHSFSQWMLKWEACDFVITHPEGMELDASFTGNAPLEYDRKKALEGADFIYVKNWSSFKDYGNVFEGGKDWMLKNSDLGKAGLGYVMHCLPVRRNLELSGEILDGERSLVLAQAENRIWSAKTILNKMNL